MHHLITGFPGFLATQLVAELAERGPEGSRYTLLCLRSERAEAERSAARLEEEHAALRGHIEVAAGDICEPELGLSDERARSIAERATFVWHLAALYDLAIPEPAAYQVNVLGTGRVLDFCERCTQLVKLNYVSTCYVSGTRSGRVYEDELDLGQGHKNHYESTKFWAEVEVQRRADSIPTAIFRPAIVVGDARTGFTPKHDGPYYVFDLLARLPAWLPVPSLGDGEARVNLVPHDFVTRALAAIGLDPERTGVYQLADRSPLRANQILSAALRQMGRAEAPVRVPARLVDRAMRSERVRRAVDLPREALVYFNHDVAYDTARADRALAELGVEGPPPLTSYLGVLLEHFLAHRA